MSQLNLFASESERSANSSAEVDAWFQEYDHPMKHTMQRVREIVLAADARLGECIKWKSPTFTFCGNLASFNPRSKKHVSLMFHTGAQIPGSHPSLEGGGGTARYVKIASVEAADELAEELETIVTAWCTFKAPSSAGLRSEVRKSARGRQPRNASSVRQEDAAEPTARTGVKPKGKRAAKKKVLKKSSSKKKNTAAVSKQSPKKAVSKKKGPARGAESSNAAASEKPLKKAVSKKRASGKKSTSKKPITRKKVAAKKTVSKSSKKKAVRRKPTKKKSKK